MYQLARRHHRGRIRQVADDEHHQAVAYQDEVHHRWHAEAHRDALEVIRVGTRAKTLQPF